MNKMKMYLNLKEWIYLSSNEPSPNTADAIWDSPFQNADYAPYVVVALLKGMSKQSIPAFVLKKLEEELVADNEPLPKISIWQKAKNKFKTQVVSNV